MTLGKAGGYCGTTRQCGHTTPSDVVALHQLVWSHSRIHPPAEALNGNRRQRARSRSRRPAHVIWDYAGIGSGSGRRSRASASRKARRSSARSKRTRAGSRAARAAGPRSPRARWRPFVVAGSPPAYGETCPTDVVPERGVCVRGTPTIELTRGALGTRGAARLGADLGSVRTSRRWCVGSGHVSQVVGLW